MPAIFLVFASLLTILYNLGTLQGAFMWLYGAEDKDGGRLRRGEAGREVMEGPERGRAVTTGLILTAMASGAGTLKRCRSRPSAHVLRR